MGSHSVAITGFFHLNSGLGFFSSVGKNEQFDTLSRLVANSSWLRRIRALVFSLCPAMPATFVARFDGRWMLTEWLKCLANTLFLRRPTPRHAHASFLSLLPP